jgi:hypothetical protein
MPGHVQQGHRDPPVDRLGAGELGRRREPILPRAREDGQFQGDGWMTGGQPEKRARYLMGVLADTTPLS